MNKKLFARIIIAAYIIIGVAAAIFELINFPVAAYGCAITLAIYALLFIWLWAISRAGF